MSLKEDLQQYIKDLLHPDQLIWKYTKEGIIWAIREDLKKLVVESEKWESERDRVFNTSLKKASEGISQALNEGDGVYRP